MAVIPVGYSQVNLKFTGAAVPRNAEVTFGVGNPTFLGPQAVAAAVADSLGDFTAWASFSNLAKITSILVKNGPNATGPFVEIPVNSGGTGTGEAVPPNVAVLVRKQTEYGGRAGSGRMYFPGLLEANVSGGGNVSSGTITSLQNAFNAFAISLDANLVPLVLLHGPNSPIGDSAPTPITGLNVDSKVATQRRRLR